MECEQLDACFAESEDVYAKSVSSLSRLSLSHRGRRKNLDEIQYRNGTDCGHAHSSGSHQPSRCTHPLCCRVRPWRLQEYGRRKELDAEKCRYYAERTVCLENRERFQRYALRSSSASFRRRKYRE